MTEHIETGCRGHSVWRDGHGYKWATSGPGGLAGCSTPIPLEAAIAAAQTACAGLQNGCPSK